MVVKKIAQTPTFEGIDQNFDLFLADYSNL